MHIDRERVVKLATIVEQLSYLPLTERILAFVRDMKARGERDVFARPAHYVAAASGSSAAASYTLQLVRADGIFAVTEIEHPSDGTADILCSSLRVNGMQYVDSDAIMDAWCDAASSEDPRSLPWPIVVGAGDTMTSVVTGSNLNTSGIMVRGFHVDELTAAVLREVGELFVEGFNQTFAAAAVMGSNLDRVFQSEKEATHLVAKETLTGDAARSNVSISLKGQKLNPKDTGTGGLVIPPKSLRKAGARLSCGISPGDSYQQLPRYTSAGGAGTAKLQTTLIGRRRYRIGA